MTDRINTGVQVETQPWMRDAACSDDDTGVFYPDPDLTDKPMIMRLHAIAIAVCRTCPVTGPCLAYAMEHNEIFGVWGGMTPSQRRSLRNERARAR